MRCEGCAAKLPGMTLQTAFSQHFEDAAIEHDGNRIRFRSIDALTYLVNDPYLMGFLTVRHAVSDIWAMGGSPTFVSHSSLSNERIIKILNRRSSPKSFGVFRTRLPPMISPCWWA